MTTRPPEVERRGPLPGITSMRVAAALLATLAMTLIASCSRTSQQTALPEGSRLLTDSAAAMRTVHTTHFTVAAQGNTPGVSLRYADGQLTDQGSAKGTAKVDQGGKLVNEEFVITGNTLYVRGPNGDYQKLPSFVSSAVYDPSVILNPDRGIAAVLASGKDASTETREPLAGVDSYRLKATFPQQSLATLIPGISEDTKGDVWIATQDSRLIEAQFRLGAGLVSVHFSDYNAPVTINTPPV
ncbi:MAG: LppX_LprAFG lipoprotein [Pseudonocardiaceae bacterium]